MPLSDKLNIFNPAYRCAVTLIVIAIFIALASLITPSSNAANHYSLSSNDAVIDRSNLVKGTNSQPLAGDDFDNSLQSVEANPEQLGQILNLGDEPSALFNTEGEQSFYLFNNYSQNRTVMKFTREEYKNIGFSEPPLSPSSADSYTQLIEEDQFLALGDRTPVILIHGIHGGDTESGFLGYFDYLI